MLKKILIGVGVLALIAVIGFGFLANKINSKLQEKEPEFRQYVTMSTEEQNAYIEKNISELAQIIMHDANSTEKANFDKMQADLELKAAELQFGRSVVAGLILSSENIVKDLSEDIKAQFKAEADALDARSHKYTELMKKYNTK